MIELFHPYAVLRTLGIPARPITNYDSVQNKEEPKPVNLVYEVYYDKDGNKSIGATSKLWLVNAP